MSEKSQIVADTPPKPHADDCERAAQMSPISAATSVKNKYGITPSKSRDTKKSSSTSTQKMKLGDKANVKTLKSRGFALDQINLVFSLFSQDATYLLSVKIER